MSVGNEVRADAITENVTRPGEVAVPSPQVSALLPQVAVPSPQAAAPWFTRCSFFAASSSFPST
jgi:hypothetical protein